VADPAGAPVAITFGWAAGWPDTTLRALTESTDAALLARKPRRARRGVAA
jgi:hypothetical protein